MKYWALTLRQFSLSFTSPAPGAGLTKQKLASVHENAPFVAFQAGDFVRNLAPHRTACTTIASQLKEDIPYKVRLNAATRNRELDPTGDAEVGFQLNDKRVKLS